MQKIQTDEAIQLIEMEYAEMPGLKLTFWQAQRLWNFPEDVCGAALSILVRTGFLRCTADGSYIRPTAA